MTNTIYDIYKYRLQVVRIVSDVLREKMAGEIALSPEPGRTIRKWREEFNVSQQSLADAMGVAHSMISDYESGRRKSPGISLVRNIVDSLLSIDKSRGSPTISKYSLEEKTDCIIAMDEFPEGVDVDRFIKWIGGKNLTEGRIPERRIRGYTIVDSLKTIMSLSSNDYTKIYGWSTERALIFTNVHYGRSPMVAVRAHPLTPAAVVYIRPDNTDPLAIKLAQLEKIPLITTQLDIQQMKKKLEELKEML